ncbi:MAG TPA: hypothetical protein VN176_06510 [Verrucomicrobiae bacterium]|jgi:general secretion pathway protein D|nr:hypothetical protein [Verrucomicrobiae bacterium]
MKLCLAILALLGCLTCLGQEPEDNPTAEQTQAQKAFHRAAELEKSGETEEALKSASVAAELVPSEKQYWTMREILRQEMAGKYLQRGNLMAEIGDRAGATAQFQSALALDPGDPYLQQRLQDVLPAKPPETKPVLQMMASVDQIEVVPKSGRQSFHVHSDTRGLYQQIGRAFDVTMQFDSTLQPHQINFDLERVDFYTAMRLAGKVTRTFWAPASSRVAIVANDSPEMRLQYERMGLSVFYVNTGSSTDVNDVATMLKNIFELRFLTVQQATNTISIRAPREQLDAVDAVMSSLVEARPEILLEVHAYELDSDRATQIGLKTPTDFQIFSIAAEVYRILGPAAPGIIDQISRTGTVDPATIPSDALGKLQGSPLLAPFVFFGKGLGLTGISTQPIGVQLAHNSSVAKSLEQVQLRAMNGEAATFRAGSRVPILTSNFTSVGISTTGQPSVGPTTPAFQYQDIGVTLKSTPHYHRGDLVTLDLELSIKSLGATQADGIPQIITREFKGNITVKNGEQAVVTGQLTDQDSRTAQGNPPVGDVPFLRDIVNANTKDRLHQEILIVVTPRIVSRPFHDSGTDMVWLSH